MPGGMPAPNFFRILSVRRKPYRFCNTSDWEAVSRPPIPKKNSMNILPGEIIDIVTEDEISLVKVKVDGLYPEKRLSAIVFDTRAHRAWPKKGHPVRLLFKETEVIIAKPAYPQ